MNPTHDIRFRGDMAPEPGTRFYRTKTGIEIGAAHTRPPPQSSDDAERIQAALLLARRAQAKPQPKATAHSIAARLGRWLRRWSQRP